MSKKPKATKTRESFFSRLNRSLTEVGIEHFNDDKDWDERVKLPAWQTARLRERHAKRKRAGRLDKEDSAKRAKRSDRG
jgi:hypothetical protein